MAPKTGSKKGYIEDKGCRWSRGARCQECPFEECLYFFSLSIRKIFASEHWQEVKIA